MPTLDLPNILSPEKEFARLARLKKAYPIFDELKVPDAGDANGYEMVGVVGELRRALRDLCNQKIAELRQEEELDNTAKDDEIKLYKKIRRENFLHIQRIKDFKATQLGGWTFTRIAFVLGLGTVSLVLGIMGLGVLLQAGLFTGFATTVLGSAILAFMLSIPFASTLGVVAGIALLIASAYVALFPLRELIKPGVYRKFKLGTHENVMFALRSTSWRRFKEKSPTLQRFGQYRNEGNGAFKSLWKALESDTWRGLLNPFNWVLKPLKFVRNFIDDVLNRYTQRRAPRYGLIKDPKTGQDARAAGRIATLLKGLNHFASLLVTWPLSFLKDLGNSPYVILRYTAGPIFLVSSILMVPVLVAAAAVVVLSYLWLSAFAVFGILFGEIGMVIGAVIGGVIGLGILLGGTILVGSLLGGWSLLSMAATIICAASVIIGSFIASGLLFFGPKFFTRLGDMAKNALGLNSFLKNVKDDCIDTAFERDIAAIKRLLGIGAGQGQQGGGPRGRGGHFGPGNGGPFFPGDDGHGPGKGPGPGGDGHDDGDSMKLLAKDPGGNPGVVNANN